MPFDHNARQSCWNSLLCGLIAYTTKYMKHNPNNFPGYKLFLLLLQSLLVYILLGLFCFFSSGTSGGYICFSTGKPKYYQFKFFYSSVANLWKILWKSISLSVGWVIFKTNLLWAAWSRYKIFTILCFSETSKQLNTFEAYYYASSS